MAAHTGTFYGIAMTAGHIYTVAGGGSGGLGDGGPATSATLNWPSAATMDVTGNLVIADSLNGRVRVVAVGTGTFYGKPMTGGNIYTVAGTGTRGFSGDGGAGTGTGTGADLSLSGENGPDGVAVGPAGNLLIADVGNSRVRSVAG